METSTEAHKSGARLDEIAERLGERTRELQERLQSFVDERPLGAVGLAFGVGYLVSGALFSRATFKAATLSGRLVLGGLLRQLVAGVGPALLAVLVAGEAQPQSTESDRPRS